jgi:DNA (cytosine-5)-methyltransferase 1
MSNKVDIRARRLELKLQQRELSERAGVSQHLLRKWERGLSVPEPEAAERLAAALDVPVDRLVQAQRKHSRSAVPGEGYTTALPTVGTVVERRRPIPDGARTVLDLFCGAGGLSFGFELSGEFVTACGIDLLPDRIATFTANHEYATGVAGDLRAYSLAEFSRLVGQVDVVVGGPPCQGFSSIRPFRTLTEGDPRNSLVEHYVLVIDKLRPRWFVFENVVGILTHERGERLEAVLNGLRAAGYEVDWRVVNAALYGVPQYRERVVIVGNRLGVKFQWPAPTHRVEYKSMAGNRSEVIRTDPLFAQHLPAAVNLMEAIGDLPSVESGQEVLAYGEVRQLTDYQKLMREGSERLTLHRATRHSKHMLEIIRHAGANISALPPGMVKSGFSSCYSRLDADRPSTTLTVNFVHPASNRCIHPHQHRALTPREGARIQSFPDRFVFRGTAAQTVKQIGNAVPPLLGKTLALAIVESERAAQREASPQRRRRTAASG